MNEALAGYRFIISCFVMWRKAHVFGHIWSQCWLTKGHENLWLSDMLRTECGWKMNPERSFPWTESQAAAVVLWDSSSKEWHVKLLLVYRVNSRENGLPPCSQRGRGALATEKHESKYNILLYTSPFSPFSLKKNLHVKINNLSCSDFYKNILFSLHPRFIFVLFEAFWSGPGVGVCYQLSK